MVVEFTHVGMFGFLPVLLPVLLADLDSDAPHLHPRIPLTGWLIRVNAWIFDVLGADAYPVTITGELDPPRLVDFS